MRQVTPSRKLFAGVLVVSAMLLSSPAVAGEGGAFEGRYEAYVQQEKAKQRVSQTKETGAQTATTGAASSKGYVTFSQLPNSPHAYGNAAQHERGR